MHNLATINGRTAMAYQGETPWHKLGTRLAGDETIAAAMTAAGLDYTVSLHPLYLSDGRLVENRHAVIRDEADATPGPILGTVSGWYSPIQNTDAFGVFEAAKNEFGLTIEAAGALGDGEKAWMLFRLPTILTPVPGDDVRGYGVAVTGHDGSHAFEFRPTPIRVVCQNTLNAAVGAGGAKGRIFGISHIGNTGREVDAAKTLVCDVMAAMTTTGETFTAMAHKRMTPADVIAFIETVFPTPKDGKETDALKDKRRTVADLVFTGVGAELAMSETDGQPNPWACYNAVTEYFDHIVPASATKDSRKLSLNRSSVFGAGFELKQLALAAARQYA